MRDEARQSGGRGRRWLFVGWVALTIIAAIYIGLVAPFTTAVHEEFYLVAVWLPPLMILLLGLGIAWLAWFVTSPRRRKDRSGPAT